VSAWKIGAEYVTIQGHLNWAAAGVGDYADLIIIWHMQFGVLIYRPRHFPVTNTAATHAPIISAPVPRPLCFGHMMSQADEIMVGYRYQYSNQVVSMLHGSDSVSDQALVIMLVRL